MSSYTDAIVPGTDWNNYLLVILEINTPQKTSILLLENLGIPRLEFLSENLKNSVKKKKKKKERKKFTFLIPKTTFGFCFLFCLFFFFFFFFGGEGKTFQTKLCKILGVPMSSLPLKSKCDGGGGNGGFHWKTVVESFQITMYCLEVCN